MKLNANEKFKSLNKSIMEHLIHEGYKVDHHGHAKKNVGKTLFRMKFFSASIRLEKNVHVVATMKRKAHSKWQRVSSYSYRQLADVMK